jgi:hypothetical protein
MLLDGNAADNEVWNIMHRQGGDGCLGSLHDSGGSGILAQHIGSLVRHIRESRISRLAVQFLLKSKGGLIPGFEHLVMCQENSQFLIVARHPLVCGFQAVEAGEPLCGVALLLVEGFAYAFAIGKIAMPPAERVEVAALEAAWRAGVGVRGRVEEHGEEGVLYQKSGRWSVAERARADAAPVAHD